MASGILGAQIRVFTVGLAPEAPPAGAEVLPLDLGRPPEPPTSGVDVYVAGDGLQVDPRAAALLGAPGGAALPGVGERLRAELAGTLGPAAALVTVAAELRGGALRVAIPAEPTVLIAALRLVTSLAGGAPVPLPPSAGPAPGPAPAPPRAAPAGLEGATAAPISLAAGGAGWGAGLAALAAAVDAGAWCPMPEALDRLPAVRQALERAGERRPVRADTGHAWSAFGFPDLRRPDAKVLLLREAGEGIELTALHRFPARVGVCGLPGGLLPPASAPPAEAAVGRSARPPAPGGRLFAVEADAIYIDRAGMVYRWDGRKEVPQGSPAQALATLALRWTER